VIVVVCVAILIFTVMYFTPGDPAIIILGQAADQASLQAERVRLGLDQPYIVQLGRFLNELFLHLDLGTSYIRNTSVMEELLQRIPRTLEIAILSMILTIVIGIPLGILSAVKQKTIYDRGSMIFALTLISVPNFWIALVMVLLFSLKLGWLPAFGIGGIQYYIMPCIANALSGIAIQMRQSRSAMLEVIRADYIVTARAKGLPEREILLKYALPNALIPIITMVGGSLANCLGGAVIIETVFAIPGTGMYIASAITQRDYPVVRGSVVFLAIVFTLVMLLVDIAYAYVDPRIKAQFENQSVGRGGVKS
jgi:peptide/nickel transport system permease protein